MTNILQENIAVDSIQLAAYLHTLKIPIKRIEKSGRFGCFFFPEDQARSEIEKFYLGKAVVEPRIFSAAIRELRSMIEQLETRGSNVG